MTDDNPTSEFHGVRALVVEDSWHIARALQSYLEAVGVVATIAGRLDQAEKLMTDQTFDVAIVDINLRGENTFELMARLKRQDVRRLPRPAIP